jgi:hypothetical protein
MNSSDVNEDPYNRERASGKRVEQGRNFPLIIDDQERRDKRLAR